jgi:hypothetical protein
MLHQVAARHRAEDHHDSNDYEHRTPNLTRIPDSLSLLIRTR